MDEVWRIGDPDRDMEQFDADWYVTGPDDPPVFRVGVDDDASWPRFQPGPLHGNTGFRPSTVSVGFDLDEVTDAVLHLDVYTGHGPTPALDVAVNGNVVRHHPRGVRRDRTEVNGPPTQVAAWVGIDVHVPAAWVRPTDNLVTVTTANVVDPDPDELRPSEPGHKHWFGSGIAWGGLSWTAVERHEPPPADVTVATTPLYVEDEGELRALLEVVLRHPSGFDHAEVEVDVGGRTWTADIPAEGRVAGEWPFLLAVTAFDEPVTVEARVTFDDDEVVTSTATLAPARKWTVHLLPHVHLDIGYTDHAARVMELHSRNLDRAVDILADHPDWAFTIDGTMIVDEYLSTRTPDAFARVREHLQSGRLGLNAYSLLFLSGLASREECYRATYHARRIADEHGVEADVAHLTDVPSYSRALPSLLVDAGIHRFVGIQNHDRAATADSDVLHLAGPFRWRGVDGAEVLTFFADAYAQMRFLFGDPPTIPGMSGMLTRHLAHYERDDHLPSHVPVLGSNSDNEDVAGGYADLADRWHEQFVWPRVRFSTLTEYFDAVAEHHDDLPVVTGDGGSFWEDGVGANAPAIARYRRAQDDLVPTETLTALTASVAAELRPDRAALDAAWDALLLGCEHTWSSAHATRRPHSHDTAEMTRWKLHQIDHAAHLVGDLQRRSMSQLGELVTTDGPSVLAFNGLAWTREVEVEVELTGDVELRDHDGRPAVVDVVGRRDDVDVVRVRAALPAFGYHVWPLGPRTAARSVDWEEVALDATLDLGPWRLRLDGGHVIGLRHGDRELVDGDADWGLGEVLHVRLGGTAEGRGLDDERSSLDGVGPAVPPAPVDVRRLEVSAVHRRTTPWGTVVRLRGRTRTLPEVEVTYRLPDGDDRVDVTVDLVKEPELAKESVYVAFPFAVDRPAVRYDRQVGWVDPTTDHHAGACNEWFTTLHGVRVGDVAWCSADAPLFALGQPVSGRWPTATDPSATILSWVMNNHWWTNYPASQEGRVTLRYAFRPGVDTDGDAARFGREVRGGALSCRTVYQDKRDRPPGPLPARAGRLLEVPSGWQGLDVQLLAPQDGDGVVLRVADLDGIARALPLADLPDWHVTHRCDATERNVEALTTDAVLDLEPWEVVTLRVRRV